MHGSWLTKEIEIQKFESLAKKQLEHWTLKLSRLVDENDLSELCYAGIKYEYFGK